MANWKLFIARRIYRSNDGKKEVSKPAMRIAISGIAVGLAVMIVSVSVVLYRGNGVLSGRLRSGAYHDGQ